jgi:hypothetical protein
LKASSHFFSTLCNNAVESFISISTFLFGTKKNKFQSKNRNPLSANNARFGAFHVHARDERDHRNQRILTVRIFVSFGASFVIRKAVFLPTID